MELPAHVCQFAIITVKILNVFPEVFHLFRLGVIDPFLLCLLQGQGSRSRKSHIMSHKFLATRIAHWVFQRSPRLKHVTYTRDSNTRVLGRDMNMCARIMNLVIQESLQQS